MLLKGHLNSFSIGCMHDTSRQTDKLAIISLDRINVAKGYGCDSEAK
jgi:hypothetical protein